MGKNDEAIHMICLAFSYVLVCLCTRHVSFADVLQHNFLLGPGCRAWLQGTQSKRHHSISMAFWTHALVLTSRPLCLWSNLFKRPWKTVQGRFEFRKPKRYSPCKKSSNESRRLEVPDTRGEDVRRPQIKKLERPLLRAHHTKIYT